MKRFLDGLKKYSRECSSYRMVLYYWSFFASLGFLARLPYNSLVLGYGEEHILLKVILPGLFWILCFLTSVLVIYYHWSEKPQ
jgi:hypothetical protein